MGRVRTRAKIIVSFVAVIVLLIGLFIIYRYNYIPHRKYSNSDFGITPYVSSFDKDSDGIDDQTDILIGVRAYLDSKPKYKSKYYTTGYPDDEYGVCTDVVVNGLLEAGYDLRELVDADIKQYPDDYHIESPDKNIDFRRVANLKVYFRRNAIPLTTDITKIEEWQAGDIVVWEHHVGIISDNRNAQGIPFVLHNASVFQADYEEDILSMWGKIIGHYRIS